MMQSNGLENRRSTQTDGAGTATPVARAATGALWFLETMIRLAR